MADTHGERDLVISRLIEAPRSAVWKAWTEPKHLEQWWCPKPWRAEVTAFDLRPGGAFCTVMHGPNGEKNDNPGSFLEIVPQQRIVFTTALTAGWRPASPWLSVTGIISMEEAGRRTQYTARALHQDAATRDRHEEMGFFEGWGTVTEQLDALAQTLT